MTYIARLSGLAAAAAMLVVAGCKDLDVGNLNGADAAGLEQAPTAQALVTAAQSLVTGWRGIDGGRASSLTRYGYEYWSFRASEPRGLTGVTTEPITGGSWSFGTIKNINLFLSAINNVAGMTDAEKAGLRGWLKMNLAIQYEDMQQAHDSFGVVLNLPADALTEVPPINTKAEVWAKIFSLMDEAYTTDLPAAGATFNFRMSAGFAGYNTPATMRPLNRALTARWRNLVAVPFGRPGYNAADWTAVQTALAASFINPATVGGAPTTGMTAAQMRAGPFHVYEATSTNGLNSVDRFSNSRYLREAQCKTVAAISGASCVADVVTSNTAGTALTYTPTNRDGRAYGANARVQIVPPSGAQNLFNVTSNIRQTDILAPTQTARIGTLAPLPVIRNEELLLLRAETYLNANPPDCANAILDINRVRTSAIAALPAITCPYVGDAALNQPLTLEDELLYEKRFSLWGETATVWLDMRHYGKARLIPHWLPEFRIFDIFPIPQAECEVRGFTTKGCFQGGYGGIQGGPNTTFQPLN